MKLLFFVHYARIFVASHWPALITSLNAEIFEPLDI